MSSPLPRQTSVLVVGAGLTGCCWRRSCSRRGVPTLMIDARAEALHWDRATVIHALSLELFKALGLVEAWVSGSGGVRVRAG